MQKSFMIGVVLGAAAMSAYEMGNRAKNQVECQKEKIKKKLENFAVFCYKFVYFCYFKRSSERFSKMILSA